jgi:hypothetical protein
VTEAVSKSTHLYYYYYYYYNVHVHTHIFLSHSFTSPLLLPVHLQLIHHPGFLLFLLSPTTLSLQPTASSQRIILSPVFGCGVRLKTSFFGGGRLVCCFGFLVGYSDEGDRQTNRRENQRAMSHTDGLCVCDKMEGGRRRKKGKTDV